MTHDTATHRPAPPPPTALSPAVRDAWLANLEVDRALAAHLAPAMLDARTPGGGMSVAEHLGHLLGSTAWWGSRLDPENATRCLALDEELTNDAGTDHRPVRDPAEVAALVPRVAEAALAAAERVPAGAPDSPHRDAASYLIHMMVHHAHHRGQILLALKTAGHPLPGEDGLWAPWRSGGPMAYGG